MAAILWSDVVGFAAALSALNGVPGDTIAGYVNEDVSVNNFGGETSYKLRLARIYLAAHMGTLALRQVAGPLQSSTAKSLSRSYAANLVKLTPFSSTPWGQLYELLLNTSPAVLGLVT